MSERDVTLGPFYKEEENGIEDEDGETVWEVNMHDPNARWAAYTIADGLEYGVATRFANDLNDAILRWLPRSILGQVVEELKDILSPSGMYSICRSDGEKLSLADQLIVGSLFDKIDKILDGKAEDVTLLGVRAARNKHD